MKWKSHAQYTADYLNYCIWLFESRKTRYMQALLEWFAACSNTNNLHATLKLIQIELILLNIDLSIFNFYQNRMKIISNLMQILQPMKARYQFRQRFQ